MQLPVIADSKKQSDQRRTDKNRLKYTKIFSDNS